MSLLPNVPTVDESGVKGFEANNLFGISAPKGTPAPVLAKLAKAIRTALSSADLNERMQAQGVELKFTSGEDFAPLIDREFRIWGKAVEMAKVKLD
jgi:tripartite-type tricarboxylate transporter receptor subunit TctC